MNCQYVWIHTSTASIAIFPPAKSTSNKNDAHQSVSASDSKIEIFRASGAGGHIQTYIRMLGRVFKTCIEFMEL